MGPGYFRSIGEVFRMRIKFSVKFFAFKPSKSSSVSLLFVKRRMFCKEELILSDIVLETIKESTVVRNKLNYNQGIIGARVQALTS